MVEQILELLRAAIGAVAGVCAIAHVWIIIRAVRERNVFFDSNNRFVNRFAWYRYWHY